MSQAPSMPMFWDAYLADTTHLTCEEHGAYLLLLGAMWRRNGMVPDDDRDIARILHLTPGRWRKIKVRLSPFLTFADGQITQKKLKETWEKTQQIIARNRENGALGGRPKSNENNDKPEPLGSRSVTPEKTLQNQSIPEKKEDTPPPPITPPAREAPAVSGGGGDFQSDEEKGGAEIDALLGEVREASGVRVVDVAAGRATVRRWLGLGLSREEILEQVKARTAKLVGKDPPDPPFALAAFDVSMDQLASAKAREPKLRPVQVVTTTPEERFEANLASAGRLIEATGSLPDWMKTAEIAAALIERDLATYDQLRRIMRPEDLPRRKA